MIDLLGPCTKDVAIINDLGLHARSAASIARVARCAKSKVWITREGESADATDVMDILTLACGKGTMITIRIDDPRDKDILTRLVALVEGGFGE